MTTTLSGPTPLPDTSSDDADRAERTRALFEAAERCSDEAERRRLLDEVVVANLAVADALAGRYAGRGVPLDDLTQTARMTLVQVTRNFSLDRGCDFLAYAVPSIRGALKRYFRDHGWVMRPPRRLQEARLAVKGAQQCLQNEHGREATVHDLSQRTGLDERVVIEALTTSSCYLPDSLDSPVGDEDLTVGARVGVEDRGFRHVEERSLLAWLLDDLRERDRRLLELRFFSGMTQDEIGQQIGVSQVQVSRMLKRLLEHMRERAGQDCAASA